MAWLWPAGSGATATEGTGDGESDAMVLTPTVHFGQKRWDNAMGSVYRAKKSHTPAKAEPIYVAWFGIIKLDTCSSIFRELDPQKDFLWHWIPSKGKSGGMLSGIKLERFSLENFESGEFVIVANVLDKKKLKMVSTKAEGGLGFRDLHSFGMAMLAKQA